MPEALVPHLPDFDVSAQVHVVSGVGPSDVTCKGCGLLRLPIYEKALACKGLSRWVCFSCWSVVIVTWSVAE